jgi:ceramide glucosyltransferase
MTTWEPLATILFFFCVLALAVSGVSRILVWCVVRHRPNTHRSSSKVTVLKPLCGADTSLSENLGHFGRQSHERLDIVLGVAEPSDEALGHALAFCRAHDHVVTRISVGENTSIDNPKLALLSHMARSMRGDWMVVSDSNVRVNERYVEDALSYAGSDIGLVTHLVCGVGGRSFAAHLENLQLNCFVAPGVCGVRFIAGRTCVIGKSMFLRTDVLDAIGGFESAGRYLAEDYVMGQAVEKAGFRVATARVPVAAWSEGRTFKGFLNRHLRWAVMRRRVSRSAYSMEVLLTPAPGLMALLAIAMQVPATGINAGWVALCLLFEQLLDVLTYARMTGGRVPLAAVALNPLRQCLTLGIWAMAWFVQTIEWRGKVYRIGPASRLEPVPQLAAAAGQGVTR